MLRRVIARVTAVRRAFVAGSAVAGVTVVVVVALVLGLLRNWQLVLAVILGVAALVLLAANVRELRRG